MRRFRCLWDRSSKRLEHQFILTPSGTGKTQLIQSMIVRDLEKVKEGNASIIVIDSQGANSTAPKKRRLVENIINLQVFATDLQGKLTYVKPGADLAFMWPSVLGTCH